MRLIELSSLDIIYKGKYLFTIEMLSISHFHPEFHMNSDCNPLLQRIMKEIEAIKKEMDR